MSSKATEKPQFVSVEIGVRTDSRRRVTCSKLHLFEN